MKACSTQPSAACTGLVFNLVPPGAWVWKTTWGRELHWLPSSLCCCVSSFMPCFTRTFTSVCVCVFPFNQNWFLCGRKKNHHNVIDWTSVQVEEVVNLWREAMYKKHVVWEYARSLYKCFPTHKRRDLCVPLDIINPCRCQGPVYRPKGALCWNRASFRKVTGRGYQFPELT